MIEQACQASFSLINLIRKKCFPTPYYFMPCLWLQHPLYRFKDNLCFIALESFRESICVFPYIKTSPHNVMHIKQALEWRCSGALGPGSSISQNVSAAWLWEQGLASKLLHQMANFTNGPRWETSLGGAHPARVGSALCFPAGSQCWLTAAGAGLARGLPKSGKPRGGSALWWSTAALLFPC